MFKKACNNLGRIEKVGKDLCPHCGTEFTTQGGLLYHTKSQVCGEYTEKHIQAIMPALQEFYHNRSQQLPGLPPAAHEQTGFKPVNNRTYAPSLGVTSPSTRPNDPYAVLSPEARRRFEGEMRAAEEHYGSLMRRAMDLPQPERDEELAKLKNSYNTKQSTTRKKYGIRLRERRTKAEIEAERTRLLAGDGNAAEPATKRARSNTEGHPVPTQRRSSSPRRDSAVEAAAMTSTSTPSATTAPEVPIVKRAILSPSTTPPRQQQSTRSGDSPEGEEDARPGSPMEMDEEVNKGGAQQSGSDSDSGAEADIPASLNPK